MKRAAFLPLFWLLLAAVASANMASPVRPGFPVGEPFGALAQVEIARERLEFDLRTLESRWRIAVSATYELVNPGDAVEASLWFVAPNLDEGRARLNTVSLATTPLENPTFAPSWQPPETTVATDGEALPYRTITPSQGLEFTATIPPGESVLSVEYDALPASTDGEVYRTYQLGYVLAPARNWGSFNHLDIQLWHPPGWQVTTSLPLSATAENQLTGSFNGLPADSFTLSARPAISTWQLTARSASRWLGGVAGFWGSAWLGRRLGGWGRSRSLWMRTFIVFVALILGGVTFVAAAGLGIGVGDVFLDDTHISNTWNYRSATTTGLAVFCGFWLAAAIALARCWRHLRMAAPSSNSPSS